ncbi:hypothetical protein V1512DRAFT_261032 [Lipomyces arxii]|uniref:uncharacterized protein n=1 Tax=Lipomyces arxii TaxID=56418 RepID=UPI0034CF9767
MLQVWYSGYHQVRCLHDIVVLRRRTLSYSSRLLRNSTKSDWKQNLKYGSRQKRDGGSYEPWTGKSKQRLKAKKGVPYWQRQSGNETITIDRKVAEGIKNRIIARRERIQQVSKLSPLYDLFFRDGNHSYGEPSQAGQKAGVEVGDLIARTSPVGDDVGVVTRIIAAGMGRAAVVLTLKRELKLMPVSNLDFVIKRFVSQEHAKDSTISLTIPANETMLLEMGIKDTSVPPPSDPQLVNMILSPPEIGRHVCQPLRAFHIESLAMRARLLPIMDEVYEKLSSNEEHKSVSLFEIGDYILSQHASTIKIDSLNVFYYALDTILATDTSRWVRSSDMRYVKLQYRAVSSKAVEDLEKGIVFLRAQDRTVVDGFREKSRQLIEYYRSVVATGQTGYHNVKPLTDTVSGLEVAFFHPTIKFTADELTIVAALKHHIFLVLQRSEDNSIASLVFRFLRDVDMWNNETITNSMVFQYLYEIGVFAPWENLQIMNPIDGQIVGISSELRYPASSHHASESGDVRKPGFSTDAMTGLRKDFGDAPVYCVDGEGAEEIDDGFSIEHVVGSDECWVHVHIANPTSVLPVDSILAEQARRNAETLYMVTYSRPMMPEQVTAATGLVKNDAGYCRALTFSARINASTGEILESAVSPSVVRNIVPITYEQLDASMDWKLSFENAALPKQYRPPKPKVSREPVLLSERDKSNLSMAYKLHLLLRQKRGENGSLTTFPLFKSKISAVPVIDQTECDGTRPVYYMREYYPQIDMEFSLLASTYLVSEFMILASRISAMYCAANGIPVPYRVQRNINLTQAELPGRREMPTLQMFRRQSVYCNSKIWTTEYSTTPSPHYDVGAMEGYLRVTSPLRRYLDMVAHWQIEAFLRNEPLPFNKSDVERLAHEYSVAVQNIKGLSRYVSQSWVLRYVHDLASRGELRLTCMTLDDVEYPASVRALCIDFSMFVRVQFSPLNKVKPGTYVVCTGIVSIDMINHAIVLKAPNVSTENCFVD